MLQAQNGNLARLVLSVLVAALALGWAGAAAA